MEGFFSSVGFGWTMSKAMPYVVFILLGVILAIAARKYFKKRILRTASLLLIFIPFVIYFMISPIYESDFANSYTTYKASNRMSEEGHLTVIAIPNCPFCSEAMDRLLKIQENTSSTSIDFRVLTDDSLALTPYLEKANGLINVIMEERIAPFAQIATGSFPTYVYTSKEETKVWNNDGIGSNALDWMEEQLASK
ncbi:MAG: hypothetical protein ACI837_000381 [Crocinitomicaceae bacterium]|jgi:hypothetical protein